MKGKSKSEVAQSCLTPSDPVECSLPGSSIHGTPQARALPLRLLGNTFLFIIIICLFIYGRAEVFIAANGLSLVAVSRGHSLAVVHRLLIAVASLVVEHTL